jgi:hypothetical protein
LIENCGGRVGESDFVESLSGESCFLASGVVGTTGVICWGVTVCFKTDRELLGTDGALARASETGLGFGVGVDGREIVVSSEVGLGLWVGVDCTETEPVLLFANVDAGDEVEPSGAFNEERWDASELSSGSLDRFLCFLRDLNPLNMWKLL